MKRPINQQNETYKRAMKVAKRITITMLCCLPVLIIFSYLTWGILNDFWQIFCFIVIMGIAVAIVEIVARDKERKKQEEAQFETKKDVFK